MKQASLLITLCALLSLSASAQTTTVEKNAKRITITTTKVDENGKTVTETWIAEGEKPEQILENMAVNPDVLQKMNEDNPSNPENAERLFIIRSAGDNTVIEGTLSDDINANDFHQQKMIIINGDDATREGKWHHKICQIYGGPASAEVWAHDKNENNNCAALGVYVTNYEDGGESKISGLIEQGGAQEAGLLEGDVIKKINEYDVTDFPSLRLALSHFQPGDVVTVRYVRDDKNQKARVELKDWAVLPGFEWRARTDCGDKEIKEEEVEPINEVVPGISEVQPLKLQDAKVFPNPTEGVFAFAFHTEPGPLTVSITDVNGKVVYNENEKNDTGSYNQEIDLKGLPQGNYIITVTQGDQSVYQSDIKTVTAYFHT